MNSAQRWLFQAVDVMEVNRKQLIALAVVVILLGGFWAVKLLGGGRLGKTDDLDRIRSLVTNANSRPRAMLGGLESDDPLVRRETLIMMRRFNHPADEALVLAATRDEDPGVRAAASKTLAGYNTDAAAQRLREIALTDEDVSVREDAITGLAMSDHPVATVTLMQMVDGTESTPDTAHVVVSITRRFRIANLPDVDDPHEMIQFATGLKMDEDVQEAYAAANETWVVDQDVWHAMVSEHAGFCHGGDTPGERPDR
jgi:hypothetical protein